VISVPDEVKGEKIVTFVILAHGQTESDELKETLIQHVRNSYGKHAKPSDVIFTDSLPKTRSGKIMRRVLRSKITGEPLGDTSTLAEA